MSRTCSRAIAETFGLDVSELAEYRYQRGRMRAAVYAIGERYYAVQVAKPTDDVGGEWRKHDDQFFATRHGVTLWVADASRD